MLTIAHRKAIDATARGRGGRCRSRSPPERGDAANGAASDGGAVEAVRELPPKQRAAVVLRFVNDLAHDEIGRVLGCSEEAARRNVHEGLKKLREAWQA